MFPYLYHVDAASNSVRTVGPLFFLRGGTYHYLSQKYPPFDGPTSWAIEAALPGKIMAYAAVGTPQPHAISELDRAYKHAVHSVLGGSAVPDSALNELASRQIREVMREVLDDSGVSADDMIASIQEYIGGLFVRSLAAAVESDGRRSRKLCFAGGCALNIKWNRQIRDLGLFDTVWVPPFPNDSGSAIGAASCAVFDLEPEPTVEWNVYSGPALLPTAPEPGWRSSACSIAELAERLHVRGEPVVMLSGRAELGPRALGHRSILAPATDPQMKGTLNRIKGREAYRPVAPICLEHRSSEVFMPGGRDAYMLFDHRVRESWRSKVPAICHLDGSARLQTVSSSDEPVIFELLSEYEKRSGVPLLCNTSANLNGRGFFPDVASAMRWGGVPAIWSDGVLYERQ
jgi:carbamoyltransferase